MKHEEQHGVVRERFQKVGDWKKLSIRNFGLYVISK